MPYNGSEGSLSLLNDCFMALYENWIVEGEPETHQIKSHLSQTTVTVQVDLQEKATSETKRNIIKGREQRTQRQ